MEEWKDVRGFEGLYQINRDGAVRRDGRILKTRKARNGYIMVGLCSGGKPSTHCLHRLIAKAYVANPDNKPHVNHIDGNKENNCPLNLEWVTRSENTIHMYRVLKVDHPRAMLGRFGEHHNRAKGFTVKFPNGEVNRYGSGLEFTRETGFDHTSISWARKSGIDPYQFKRGRLKGVSVSFADHFEIA